MLEYNILSKILPSERYKLYRFYSTLEQGDWSFLITILLFSVLQARLDDKHILIAIVFNKHIGIQIEAISLHKSASKYFFQKLSWYP